MDLLLVNGRGEAVTLYHNDVRTKGVFTDVTKEKGLSKAGTNGYTDSVAWGDYDNDGNLDFYITAEHGNDNRLYHNDGHTFTDVTAIYGLSVSYGGLHTTWADYDNDGNLDLYVVTKESSDSRLFHNEVAQGKGFVITGEMPDKPAFERSRWGGSWGDMDNDGSLDHIVTGDGRRPYLYRNNSSKNGNHWLHIKLIGRVSNRSAIGATIRIKTGGIEQMRHIASYGRYSSQNTFPVTFGLGKNTKIDSLSIKWPSGIQQELRDVVADQILTIKE